FINPVNRWPPSVGFLLLGGVSVFLLTQFYYLVRDKIPIPLLWRNISYIGSDAYDLYLTHLLILILFSRLTLYTTDNIYLLLAGFAVLFLLSVILSSLNFSYSASIFHLPVELSGARRYKVKKRYILSVIILLVFLHISFQKNPSASQYGNIVTESEVAAVLESIGRILPIERRGQDFTVSINRQWFLKSDTSARQKDSLVIKVETEAVETATSQYTYTYEIQDTDVYGQISEIIDTDYFQLVKLDHLPVGIYDLIVARIQKGKPETIQTFTIYISEPLYVAWSLDWEGFNIPQTALAQVDSLSVRHHALPVSHFINPAIFLSPATDAEKRNFADWLNNRAYMYGDEIALHLHMFTNLVAYAGIALKTEPVWGYATGDGYDVPITAYSRDELRLLFKAAFRLFADYNLPPPVGFRSGGWFMNTELFEILEESGFSYDSSGRDNTKWNNRLSSGWNLTASTRPYYPSRQDINATADNDFTVLEVPNNGGNTFERGPQALISAFRANYKGGIMPQKQALVYLSHPDWAEREFTAIDSVLTEIDTSLFSLDKGPVVYLSLYDIYELWK
ncbi:hypothetical protein A2154_00395, partial [Candidatus Gottesmanbacteria bacterium RBG_16_43_7]